jgi:hypothetical protein
MLVIDLVRVRLQILRLAQPEASCRRPEASDIDALQEFSRQLRCYGLSAAR